MNFLKGQAKSLRSTTPTNFDERRAQVLYKRANIDNFEQPEFKGVLTNEQMKKLYRHRAIANTAKLAVGTGGAIAGASVLGGAAMFMQPSTVALGATAGYVAGDSIGSGLTALAIGGGRHIESGIRYLRSDKIQHRPGSAAGNQAPISNITTMTEHEDIQTSTNVGSPRAPLNNDHPGQEPEMVIFDIHKESIEAMRSVLSPGGDMRSSNALKALQQANVETEKYIAALKESGNTVTTEMERTKRIEFQVTSVTEEILRKMSINPDYDKDGDKYKEAKEYITAKVQEIIEKKNRPTF